MPILTYSLATIFILSVVITILVPIIYKNQRKRIFQILLLLSSIIFILLFFSLFLTINRKNNYSGIFRPTRGWNRPGLRPGGKAHSVFDGACCILNL